MQVSHKFMDHFRAIFKLQISEACSRESSQNYMIITIEIHVVYVFVAESVQVCLHTKSNNQVHKPVEMV